MDQILLDLIKHLARTFGFYMDLKERSEILLTVTFEHILRLIKTDEDISMTYNIKAFRHQELIFIP